MADDDYTLTPVDFDPFVNPIPEGTTQQLGNVVKGVGQGIGNALTLPGAVATGQGNVQPAVPGQWSDEDEARLQATNATIGNRATDLAGLVTTGAMPASETNALGMGIRAYHGSPYDFDKFDISKIGTGEGAQAYGHGLYFAENPGTAKSYRDALDPNKRYLPLAVSKELKAGTPPDQIWSKLSADPLLRSRTPQEIDNAIEYVKNNPNLDTSKMYEVSLNADPEHFLDWDKPLSEQSPKVKQILQAGKWAGPGADETGAEFLKGLSPEDHLQLGKEGIPGIKYLDQGSRGKGDGTRNFVVFDPKVIDIIKKYGIAGLVGGGAAHFSTQPVDKDPFSSGMATGGSVKPTKAQVRYRAGNKERHCRICVMWCPPHGCSAVTGTIAPKGVCDLYEAKH